MNILMVLESDFPPDIRVENEAETLVKAGHNVNIACYSRQGRKEYDNYSGIVIHRRPISKFIYKSSVGALKFPFYFNFWRSFLNELFQKYEFDAIHVHDLPLAKVGKEMSVKYNVKFVLDLHENWPALLDVSDHTKGMAGRMLSNSKQWRAYELEYCKKADDIVVVVYEAKDRLVKSGINPDKISVVSNTLNFNNFELVSGAPDPQFITAVYAGGITRHRGLQYVIKGVKYVDDNSFRVWILGDGAYKNELINLVKEEGVEDKVKLLGWKTFKEMQSYLGKADIFLIPHVKSGHTDSTIPHKIFQYMFYGKPMIVSDCAPLERIVKETKSGIVYRFDDPKDFGDKVNSLIKGKSDVEIDTDFARLKVKNKYNWENDSKVLLKLYK